MTSTPIVRGGILAAGAGIRLRQAGWAMSKPLVPVAGVRLIERVIGNFVAAGITSLVIIVNEADRECVEWVRRRFGDLDLRFLVKTTRSSLESFLEVARHLDEVRGLISTVDAWCLEADFVKFVEAARELPPDALVLAVTPFVADERPLWVSLDEAGRVTRLGGSSGEMVTAGVYLAPARIARRSSPSGLGSLRDYLVWLVEQENPVYAAVIQTVVDVDRAEDVVLAEALVRRASQTAGGAR